MNFLTNDDYIISNSAVMTDFGWVSYFLLNSFYAQCYKKCIKCYHITKKWFVNQLGRDILVNWVEYVFVLINFSHSINFWPEVIYSSFFFIMFKSLILWKKKTNQSSEKSKVWILDSSDYCRNNIEFQHFFC